MCKCPGCTKCPVESAASTCTPCSLGDHRGKTDKPFPGVRAPG